MEHCYVNDVQIHGSIEIFVRVLGLDYDSGVLEAIKGDSLRTDVLK